LGIEAAGRRPAFAAHRRCSAAIRGCAAAHARCARCDGNRDAKGFRHGSAFC
jgi:hypothetical protein